MVCWLNFVWQMSPDPGTEIIREIVEQLDRGGLALSFHFFYEPAIELRIELESDRIDDVVEIVNRAFSRRSLDPPEMKEYADEDDYGERGWQIVKKYFEYSSRIALEKDQPDGGRDGRNMFADHKLVHCFLNQQGMTTLDEARFHQERYRERLLIASQRLK